jgi:hypothetical protein
MNPPIAEKTFTEKKLDLQESQKIDITPIKTVCMTLGPYRNLTTLTAAILFLHPNCQVLNHAGNRIFGDINLDFFANYNTSIFEAFTRYAIYISKKGRRGDYGGSITLSHAYDDHFVMRNIYKRTDSSLLKENITTLFWKESLRTSNHIRRHNVDLDSLFKTNRQIRFLLPIRNPLDCAASNFRTQKVAIFENNNKNSDIKEILKSILEEIFWFKNLEARYPERFFYFFEHSFNESTIVRMADFLQLAPLGEWCSNALEAFDVKSKYTHSNDLISFFHQFVEKQFSNFPDFAEKLMCFGQNGPAKSQ